MSKIGYARVSTLKQDLGEQINVLEKFGCTKIFAGKHSGKADKNREQLDELLNYIREGDVVVVTKLDRLGRSLTQCLNTLELFKKRKVGFIAIQQGINTQTQDNPYWQVVLKCPLQLQFIPLKIIQSPTLNWLIKYITWMTLNNGKTRLAAS